MEIHFGFGAERSLPVRRGRSRRHVHGCQHFDRDRRFIQLLRSRRVVALDLPRAGFILHLHQQHGALRVDLLKVPHERGERMDIGVKRSLSERRWRIHRAAVFAGDVLVLLRIPLHPLRRVMLAAVLIESEPEQNQVNMMLAGLCEQRVCHGVVELPWLRLELFPVDRHLDRIGV